MDLVMDRLKKQFGLSPFYVVLILTSAITLVPILWVWISSLKSNKEIRESALGLPSNLLFDNYRNAWSGAHFDLYFLNSIVVSLLTVGFVILLGSLAAYSFAKMRFRGNRLIFFVFLLGMAFPVSAKVGPLVSLVYQLGLANTRFGLVVVYTAATLPFAILMLRAFFYDFPQELEDSAALDGCNRFQFYLKILLPLSIPALVTLGIFVFMNSWNEFFLAILLISEDSVRTLPLGLMYFQGEYYQDYSLSLAGINITAIPIIVVYLIFQRSFIEGITAGTTK